MTQQTTVLNETESKDLIAKFHETRKTMNRTLDKLVEAPWKKLAEEGLSTLAARACMLQEGLPISKARSIVREYEATLK